MNTFPANAIPQFQPGAHPGAPGAHPGHPFPPGAAPGLPPGMQAMDPAHLAMLQQQQQTFLAQQQQLAAMGQQQLQMRQPSGKKSKKQSARAAAQAQVLPRHMAAMAPPHGNEHYVKNAMAPPTAADVDPWADRLDELDPRELAMNRYRARNEMMAEVFGPEQIKEIPDAQLDPWKGLGLDGETLEAKVLALESSNAELEAKFDEELDAFRKRLEAAGSEATPA